MSEDPERDDGDEESPDSPPSGSDPSSGDPSAEEPDDEPVPTDESEPEPADEESGDEPQPVREDKESGEESEHEPADEESATEPEPDSEATESASPFDGESETGSPEGMYPYESVSEEGDGEGAESGEIAEGGTDAESGADAEDGVEAEDGADGDDAESATPDEDSGGESADDTDSSVDGPTDDSADGPAEDVGDPGDVEEFTVPDMGTDDQADQDLELVDEDEVADVTPPDEVSDEPLPENQGGVGVDVPQQTLEDEGDDDLWGEGPDSDQEMPLADHIEEMMRRLSVVFLVAGVVALTLLGLGQAVEPLPTAVELIDALWNNAIPGAPELADRRPRLYGPLELILTKLKVTALAGLLIGLPVFVYETYLFMRPGLYRHERRYYLAAVPTSLVLGTIGMAFAHYVIIPAIMDYFTVYTQENIASVAYGLAETFNLILVLMAYMAVVFQIPLFIMLAIMMGLTTRLWLEDKRLLFWGGFLTVAFLINPDPTGMTPFIIAATMIVLYEGTLALLRWTGN